MQMKGVYKISIFVNDYVSLAEGKLIDSGISCAIAKR